MRRSGRAEAGHFFRARELDPTLEASTMEQAGEASSAAAPHAGGAGTSGETAYVISMTVLLFYFLRIRLTI